MLVQAVALFEAPKRSEADVLYAYKFRPYKGVTLRLTQEKVAHHGSVLFK